MANCPRVCGTLDEGCDLSLRGPLACISSFGLLNAAMYRDKAVAVILTPFSSRTRINMLSEYPFSRSFINSGKTARTRSRIMHESGCGVGSVVFCARNERTSATWFDVNNCTFLRSLSIAFPCGHEEQWHVENNITHNTAKMYYTDAGVAQTEGKMGAVRTKPFQGSARPPPFLQSACGYSEKWLRILLRAAPRDPTERTMQMPRPKRAQDVTSRLYIRVSNFEKSKIKSLAEATGLTISEYIRRCSLNIRIRSRMSEKAIGELSRLGGLQKHLLMQIKDIPHNMELRRDLNAALEAIHKTLKIVIKHALESE